MIFPLLLLSSLLPDGATGLTMDYVFDCSSGRCRQINKKIYPLEGSRNLTLINHSEPQTITAISEPGNLNWIFAFRIHRNPQFTETMIEHSPVRFCIADYYDWSHACFPVNITPLTFVFFQQPVRRRLKFTLHYGFDHDEARGFGAHLLRQRLFDSNLTLPTTLEIEVRYRINEAATGS